MRRNLTMLMLTLTMALPGAARAGDAAAFEAVAELPAARVMCLGAAAFPEMLRFAFQAEPEGNGRPELMRTSSARRGARQTAPRHVAPAAAPSLPVLHLPCIQG